MKKYQKYLYKILKIYLNRDFSIDDVLIVEENSNGPEIKKWNVIEEKPNEELLENIYLNNEFEILLEIATKKIDSKYYKILFDLEFEKLKISNNDYKNDIKNIEKMSIEQLEKFLNDN